MSLPIVFFPGIMGSRLYFKQSRKFWDPDSTWHMSSWVPLWPFRSDDDNRIDLHARQPATVVIDNASHITDAQRDRGWSTVSWTFYGSMLQAFETTGAATPADPGFPVWAVGYDWRQDIGWLAGYVADKIDRILADTGAAQIRVVTHSMGGLVIRAALSVRPDLRDKIAVLVHVCQPSAGGVVLYRRLFTGDVAALDGTGVLDRVIEVLLGNSRSGFVGNMSGLPGAMQLLPSRFFPLDADGNPWHPELGAEGPEALYADAASPPGLVPDYLGLTAEVISDLKDRLVDVAQFHGSLGDPAVPHHPNCWLVYGISVKTDVAISIGADGGVVPATSTDGDGTVPVISATSLKLPSGRMISVANAEHSQACNNLTVQGQLQTILANP